MEAMVSSRNTAPLPTLVWEIASEYEAENENYTQMLTKVGSTIQNGGFPQENAAPQDILALLLAADEVYCEVPFCRKNGSEIWHGIMDVVYRIGEQWFILDYLNMRKICDVSNLYGHVGCGGIGIICRLLIQSLSLLCKYHIKPIVGTIQIIAGIVSALVINDHRRIPVRTIPLGQGQLAEIVFIIRLTIFFGMREDNGLLYITTIV